MRRGVVIFTAVSLVASPGAESLAADESCAHLPAGCPADYDAEGHGRPNVPAPRLSSVVPSTGNVSSGPVSFESVGAGLSSSRLTK